MPRRLSEQQIATLHKAVIDGFPGLPGQATLRVLFFYANVEYERHETVGSTFEETVLRMLRAANQQDQAIDNLLEKLADCDRPTVVATVTSLQQTTTPAPADSRVRLVAERLIIDGDPFVDRDHLRTAILPALLDGSRPLRAVVIQGPCDSGKSFSLRLIRVCSRAEPPPTRFRVLHIDLAACELTRDSLALAREVADALKLDDVRMPRMDAGEARIARRLVDAIAHAREYADRQLPTILVIDHLDKEVAPAVVDFAEELALAAAEGRLDQMKVVLIGLPRAPSPNFPIGKLLPDAVVQPGPTQVGEYLDRVLELLDKDVDDATFTRLVAEIFQGHQPPYSREFMFELPRRVDRIIEVISSMEPADDP
jgi:hypothetical protein